MHTPGFDNALSRTVRTVLSAPALDLGARRELTSPRRSRAIRTQRIFPLSFFFLLPPIPFQRTTSGALTLFSSALITHPRTTSTMVSHFPAAPATPANFGPSTDHLDLLDTSYAEARTTIPASPTKYQLMSPEVSRVPRSTRRPTFHESQIDAT